MKKDKADKFSLGMVPLDYHFGSTFPSSTILAHKTNYFWCGFAEDVKTAQKGQSRAQQKAAARQKTRAETIKFKDNKAKEKRRNDAIKQFQVVQKVETYKMMASTTSANTFVNTPKKVNCVKYYKNA